MQDVIAEWRSSGGTAALKMSVTAGTLVRAEMCVSLEMNHFSLVSKHGEEHLRVDRVQNTKQPLQRLSLQSRPLTQWTDVY